MTRDEVAQKLRVSVRTVSAYVAAGILSKPARLGRKPLWAEEVIARDVERNRAKRLNGLADVERTSATQAKRSPGRPRKL